MSKNLIVAVALQDDNGNPFINHSLISDHYRLRSCFLKDANGGIYFRIIILTVEGEDLLNYPSYTPQVYIDVPLKTGVDEKFEESTVAITENSLINGALGIEISKVILTDFHREFADLVIRGSQRDGLVEIDKVIITDIENRIDKILEEKANKK